MSITIILGVILIALITQATVNSLKRLWKGVSFARLLNIISGILIAVGLCVGSHMDLMTGFGYPLQFPGGVYVGAVISGIIASLGAGTIYEILNGFNEYKNKIKEANHGNQSSSN